MSHNHESQNGHFDLHAAARRILLAAQFEPDIDAAAHKQLDALTAPAPTPAGVRDLRQLPWSSIDNTESRDLDQVEVAEALPDGSIKMIVGIADVDSLVPKGSPLDQHALANCTSVYTGIDVFPMLPEKLSTDLTSLNENADRLAIAIETVVDRNGDVASFDVYRAMVHNYAKLAYDSVGEWLGGGNVPDKVNGNAALSNQLKLQRDAAQRLKAERLRNGALELETIEATPVTKDGRIVDLAVVHKNQARDLIEDFMIASNVAIAKFLEARGRSGIRRVVREPERWGRIVELAKRYGTTLPDAPDSLALANFLAERRAADPERFPDLSLSIVKLMGPGIYALDLPGKDPGGHFGLATHDYSHATAPNRRYADLVTQRLVKAALADQPAPYSNEELASVAARCTEREDAENKVERTIRKTAAALLLRDRIGETFDAIVTGANDKGTFVRTIRPPAEGMVVRQHEGFDVGDRVRVKLVGADPNRGFIDFEGRGER
ncbi:MAG TPA: RNB domain-containing ribonuclease [Gemmatimonadaceae bacterium]|jgi:exoribonuclease-2|nr:RNB domain-containing ribonuclease [Gemmatimonadaceae bacterium]